MRFFLLVALILSPPGLYAATKGALENPQPDDYASGIYLISGWVCDANEVQILLDGAQYIDVPYGSDRQDTIPACGDANNGFGVLVNVANLGAGEHSASLIADGQVLATHAFNTANTSKGEFETDLQACAVVENFPASNRETHLQWITSMQGFQIKEESERTVSIDLDGIWIADYWEAALWTYRSSCGSLSVFIHANLSDEVDGEDVLKMSGEAIGASFVLTSTEADSIDREARFTIKSQEQVQIDFTACNSDVPSCDFTPEGGRVILTKVPNVMDRSSRVAE